MPTATLHRLTPELSSEDERRDLARVVAALFERWQLDTELQMQLLGMSPKSRKQLPKYRAGEHPLPGSRDTLDRVGYLLGIHKGLRLLFPEDEQLRFSWVHRRNRALEGATPLEVMVRDGLLGIARVARLVDFQRGR
ncbi:MbcA/ParS/Xre antitoxin family protein [Stutzerimonas azotifigens]|uniref:MbcA/ParS/Xre antitoxin family protein n=1 Tax=Stutzerimonas azotifigens TaxID=291995 RepID=UPI0004010F63|nr:MbcA/ParS/Xre antitoxin family protein [Stutzerimonas azotifigens]